MPKKKHDELTAGIFVILALGAVVGIIIWLGAWDWFKPARQRAYFYTEAPTALQVGNLVKVADTVVGKVTDNYLSDDASRTIIVAEVDRGDVKIHSDGKAKVVAGLLGNATLVVESRGRKDQPLADLEHPVAISPSGLEAAFNDLASTAAKLNQMADMVKAQLDIGQRTAMLAKINQMIDQLKAASIEVARSASNVRQQTEVQNSDSVMARLGKTMDNVQQVSQSLRHEVDPTSQPSMFGKIHRSLDDVNAISSDARPKLSKTLTAVQSTAENVDRYSKKDVAEILLKLRETSTEILRLSQNFSVTSGEIRDIVVLNRDNLDRMIDNFTQVSADLKATAKEVRRAPWKLLYTPTEKELHSTDIYDAARAFSNGAEQLDQAITKLANLSKAHPNGVRADDAELQKIRQDIQETFNNFSKAEQALWKELSK